MQDFTSHLLRSYFASTDWHPANSYLHLTSSSSTILLDFPIPTGVSLAVSSSPSSTFYSNHRLRCMPHLTGSAGYVFARTEKPLRLVGQEGDQDGESGIAGLRLRQCLDRFRIVNVPKRPEPKTQRWETDSGVEKRGEKGRDQSGDTDVVTDAKLSSLQFSTRLPIVWLSPCSLCSTGRSAHHTDITHLEPHCHGLLLSPSAAVDVQLQCSQFSRIISATSAAKSWCHGSRRYQSALYASE